MKLRLVVLLSALWFIACGKSSPNPVPDPVLFDVLPVVYSASADPAPIPTLAPTDTTPTPQPSPSPTEPPAPCFGRTAQAQWVSPVGGIVPRGSVPLSCVMPTGTDPRCAVEIAYGYDVGGGTRLISSTWDTSGLSPGTYTLRCAPIEEIGITSAPWSEVSVTVPFPPD